MWVTKSFKASLLVVLVALSSASNAPAILIGLDNASNPPYTDGWQTGDNGGTGFGPWTLVSNGNPNQTGFFIGSSANNGTAPSGNIDVAGKSWGMYSNTNVAAEAIRPLTGGGLAVGQHLSLDMDNGFINNGGSVGVSLRSGTTNRFELFFNGGQNNYTYADATGNHDTGVGFTANGLNLDLTLTGPDAYLFQIHPGSVNDPIAFSGTLSGTAGSAIDTVRLFNFNAGGGGASDAFFNNLAVPEPGFAGLLGVGALTVLARRRRRN
jgi:hypothetical protein